MIKSETVDASGSMKMAGALWSLTKLEGVKISATDGEGGRVHDFYFDDIDWTVRFLVATTGHWGRGRRVLLPATVLIGPALDEQSFAVALSHEEVCKSPGEDNERPVSRIRELEFKTRYNWPFHWGGVSAWVGPVPPVPPIEPPPPPDEENSATVHLRSVLELTGYRVAGPDGEVGLLADFIADDKAWKIRCLIILVGEGHLRRKVAVTTNHVTGPISWSAKTVTVDLTLPAVENLPTHISA